MNLQILSENHMAFTTKKSKLSLILSQSDYNQNMQPFLCQKISSSCTVASHPLHGPPSNNSYSFVHLMLDIHLGIWDYVIQGTSSVIIIDILSCRQNLMLALKDSFLFKKIACTALFLSIYFVQWSSDKWTVHMQGLASLRMLERDAESFFPLPILHNAIASVHI
jgi:hypothetical protein